MSDETAEYAEQRGAQEERRAVVRWLEKRRKKEKRKILASGGHVAAADVYEMFKELIREITQGDHVR